MITIENLVNEYELDLNKSNQKEYILTINSRDDNNNIPWAVTFVSNNSIKYNEESVDKLHLTFDLASIKNGEYIIIENYKKEKARILIKPNLKESAEKKFTFRICQYEILDDNKIKLMVKSEVNSEYLKWKCSYDGKPLSYDIDVQRNYVIIELKSIIFADAIGYIELAQDKSNKNINIQLLHHKDDKLKVLRIY